MTRTVIPKTELPRVADKIRATGTGSKIHILDRELEFSSIEDNDGTVRAIGTNVMSHSTCEVVVGPNEGFIY